MMEELVKVLKVGLYISACRVACRVACGELLVERLTGIKPTLGCSGAISFAVVEQSSIFRGL